MLRIRGERGQPSDGRPPRATAFRIRSVSDVHCRLFRGLALSLWGIAREVKPMAPRQECIHSRCCRSRR
ncbi:hypothetical protein AvCA_41960 [Azotobacter vinelandii CA]|uniref:Uncharacterized protein n=2 Tax=Azotobacter vinelandii TaxID=354 RepID=C1DEZ5_AZOVD|nr:hypothetical protein Avin_41960 [Azotobacter vinelandii DJ]AGK14424.1 hypothetical protein AvCA_41960 [Azotobacter vinelandii CA]AGK21850.1 hypothetical protein AvCA6_41960 [Azotobacter vinelandii CA6]